MKLEQWQAENGKYLAASLHWLRLRLEQLSRSAVPVVEVGPTMFERLSRRRGSVSPASANPEVGPAEQAREAATKIEPAPALLLLARELRLTPFERDTLFLCAALELDTRIPGLCARAQGNNDQPHATFALALSLFDSPSWDALSPQRPLRHWRLIEVNQTGAQPLTTAPLRADERIVNYIKGLNAMDERLALLASPVVQVGGDLPPSQQSKVDALLQQWQNVPAGDLPPVCVLLGNHADAKLIIAQRAAAGIKRQLHRIGADSLPSQPAEIESLARLWQRESALLPLALYIDAQTGGASPDQMNALERFVSRAAVSDSVLMIGSREPLSRLSASSFVLDVGRPAMNEQQLEWEKALGALDETGRKHAASLLASEFSLNAHEIHRAVLGTPGDPVETLGDRLWDACRDRTRPRLDTLAQRIDARATWQDLVVTEETASLLREIATQVRYRGIVYEDWGFGQRMNRGLGISALFAGESGTGKTMAAEVIANDLRLSLYRIDLSQVVSKYIGETEKNLQRVFDLMEGGGSILFFDEADALFGKRSEVKDSHDRYANIEINYLLQRMESYTGLAILATNMKSALDPAFIRRLRFIVPFQFPGAVERREMWIKAFPPNVPVEALDYDRLAKLHLTGASIHNIALNAAFLAARDGAAVTMPLVLRAVRGEFRKIEKPVSEAELRV